MKKGLLTTIAGAALIAGGGLAAAQSTSGGDMGGYQTPSQDQPGATQNPSERRPGMMEKSPSQGRSATEPKKEQRSGQPGMMEKTPSQGRSAAEERGYRSRERGATEGRAQGRSAEQNRGGITEQRSAASVTLSPDQRTRLHEVITGTSIHHVGRVNFPLSVGTRIPSTVALYDVPASIVSIVPQYRGYRYFVAGNELIIIDPYTLQIVVVVPAG